MGKSLFDKVWDLHKVQTLPTGQDQIFIGLHLVHEVTSPQAFQMLRERGLPVLHPERTYATVDHIIPTDDQTRPFADTLAEQMFAAMEENTREFGITFYDLQSENQGIVHVIGPELGLSCPGMTIACGDSHTSTHGAVGAIAFGIGTTQVRDVLASQTLALDRLKVRKIEINGNLERGVSAKDIILMVISRLGVKGGIGYAYEYGGTAITGLDMDGRLTVCNMSIEGGARAGYINPDEKTFTYLENRQFTPKGEEFEKAVEYWQSIASDDDAHYDDVVQLEAADIEPMVAWGINPAQAVGISDSLPQVESQTQDKATLERAYSHTGFSPGSAIKGQKIDVAFIGSCTNGRLADLREAAEVLKGRKVAGSVRALAVPGSKTVKKLAEAEGLHRVFEEAGFQWRDAGCSMCLGMNPDILKGREVSASSSNRNFIGRQGSPNGRTMLMSPAMVAAAAVAGELTDVREMRGRG